MYTYTYIAYICICILAEGCTLYTATHIDQALEMRYKPTTNTTTTTSAANGSLRRGWRTVVLILIVCGRIGALGNTGGRQRRSAPVLRALLLIARPPLTSRGAGLNGGRHVQQRGAGLGRGDEPAAGPRRQVAGQVCGLCCGSGHPILFRRSGAGESGRCRGATGSSFALKGPLKTVQVLFVHGVVKRVCNAEHRKQSTVTVVNSATCVKCDLNFKMIY